MAENSDPKSLPGQEGDKMDVDAVEAGKEADRASIYSSCGSLSFVITEELDKISPEANNIEMTSYMTQSQYSQVVFQDIADRYPNTQDLFCSYTLTGELESSENDRIGIFRVPSFAAHDYVTFKWVAHESPLDAKKKSFSIVFEASSLPKDEDFYQFQYLRGDQVFGASVPFHFRGGEELCAVEEDEEFLRVDRETDFAHRNLIDKLGSMTSENDNLKSQLEEAEQKVATMSTEMEKMKEEFKSKQESFVVLDEQYKSHQESSSKEIEQLKTDFAFALQDKLVLEERLHKLQKTIKELQTERDMLSGKANQISREKRLLEEEMGSLLSRLDEDKNLLMATAKAKEMAVAEIKNYIVKNDDLQKRMDRLQRELEATGAQNENLKLVLDSLKAKLEDAESGKEEAAKSKDLIILELEAKLELKDEEIEGLKSQISLKQKEFDILSSELVNRSKSKFKEIDSLKKQLAEAERTLSKHMSGGAAGGSGISSVLESLSQLEVADDDCQEGDEERSNLKKLEDRIRLLHSEFKQVEQNHADEIKSIKEELESIRSNAMTQSYNSSASSDSRHLLESNVIYERVLSSQERQPATPPQSAAASQTLTRQESIASQTESLTSQDRQTMTSREDALPSAPAMTEPVAFGTRFSPEPQAAPRSVGFGNPFTNIFRPFLEPQQQQPPPQQQQPQLPEPLIPQRVSGQPESFKESSVEDDFKALAAWAKGSISSSLSSLTRDITGLPEAQVVPDEAAGQPASVEANAGRNDSVIVITDDGRTFEAPKENPSCPFCSKQYQPTELASLQLHVESHMERSQTCPLCQQVFDFRDGDRTEYEAHVQGHFPEDHSYVEVVQRQDQPRDRFWFADFD